MNHLRFWTNDHNTIDLYDVSAISTTSQSGLGENAVYCYSVAFKGGAVLKVQGHSLNKQFRQYHQIDPQSDSASEKD